MARITQRDKHIFNRAPAACSRAHIQLRRRSPPPHVLLDADKINLQIAKSFCYAWLRAVTQEHCRYADCPDRRGPWQLLKLLDWGRKVAAMGPTPEIDRRNMQNVRTCMLNNIRVRIAERKRQSSIS